MIKFQIFQNIVLMQNFIRLPLSNFAYSSTDSWKPLIYVSDWLIFCCGNLILHQKKKSKWWKHRFCHEKQKMPKKYITALSSIFLWTRPTDPWCNIFQTLERRRKYIVIILSDEHTPWEQFPVFQYLTHFSPMFHFL